MVPRLVARGCVLRAWHPSDVDALAALANDRRIARNLTHLFPHPYTRDDAVAWITQIAPARAEILAWAIETDGVLAGGGGLILGEGVYKRTGEIGYWLGVDHWGRGVATVATTAIVDWAFSSTALERLEAGVFAWNPASMRVLEKCGFRREGVLRRSVERFGELTDRVVYARLRDEPA
jgi:ribosomal-protein-alanine N-acetyltransferase